MCIIFSSKLNHFNPGQTMFQAGEYAGMIQAHKTQPSWDTISLFMGLTGGKHFMGWRG